MIHGGCLCGRVRYEISGAVKKLVHCHCSMCRKAHGAAFGSYVMLAGKDFRVVSGQDDVTAYESSPGVQRTFCRRCGSTLQFRSAKRPDSVELAAGTLDDDPGVKPAYHIFVGSKAPWFEITDSLPQHAARPQLTK
jgi:hypothetical protein